jgi:AcrR family transcriptional regulator
MTGAVSDREQAILSAAMIAFGRYGFARTTMDDIATASGVARTALYRCYRNKEDIFRALARAVHAEALDFARAALVTRAPFRQRLEDALIARDVHLLEVGHTGPHAHEIAGLYLSLAADLATSSNETVVSMVARATQTAIKEKAFKLKPAYRSTKDFVHLLRLGLEGVKKEVKSPKAFERLARQLIAAMCD